MIRHDSIFMVLLTPTILNLDNVHNRNDSFLYGCVVLCNRIHPFTNNNICVQRVKTLFISENDDEDVKHVRCRYCVRAW